MGKVWAEYCQAGDAFQTHLWQPGLKPSAAPWPSLLLSTGPCPCTSPCGMSRVGRHGRCCARRCTGLLALSRCSTSLGCCVLNAVRLLGSWSLGYVHLSRAFVPFAVRTWAQPPWGLGGGGEGLPFASPSHEGQGAGGYFAKCISTGHLQT